MGIAVGTGVLAGPLPVCPIQGLSGVLELPSTPSLTRPQRKICVFVWDGAEYTRRGRQTLESPLFFSPTRVQIWICIFISKWECRFHGPRNSSPPIFIHLFCNNVLPPHFQFQMSRMAYEKFMVSHPWRFYSGRKREKKNIITSFASVIWWLVSDDYFWGSSTCGLIPWGESLWASERQKYLTAQFSMRSTWYYFLWTRLCS